MVKRDLQQLRAKNSRQAARIEELERGAGIKERRQGCFKQLVIRLLIKRATLPHRPSAGTSEIETQTTISKRDMHFRYRDYHLCEFTNLDEWKGCTREAHLVGMALVLENAKRDLEEKNVEMQRLERERRALVKTPLQLHLRSANVRLAREAAAATKRAREQATLSKPIPLLLAELQSATAPPEPGLHTTPPWTSQLDDGTTPLVAPPAPAIWFHPISTPTVDLHTSLDTLNNVRDLVGRGSGFEMLQQDWEGRRVAVFTYNKWNPRMFPPLQEFDENLYANRVRRELRGLVFDATTGEVLVRPLQNFFEIGQISDSKRKDLHELWKAPVEVLHKLDGAMVAGMWDRGAVRFTTRRGHTHLCKEVEDFVRHSLPAAGKLVEYVYAQGCTAIFEFLTPALPFRVTSQHTRLVLTTVRHRVRGHVIPYYEMQGIGRMFEVDVVGQAMAAGTFTTVGQVDTHVRKQQATEGVVVRWAGGAALKIKTDWWKMATAEHAIDWRQRLQERLLQQTRNTARAARFRDKQLRVVVLGLAADYPAHKVLGWWSHVVRVEDVRETETGRRRVVIATFTSPTDASDALREGPHGGIWAAQHVRFVPAYSHRTAQRTGTVCYTYWQYGWAWGADRMVGRRQQGFAVANGRRALHEDVVTMARAEEVAEALRGRKWKQYKKPFQTSALRRQAIGAYNEARAVVAKQQGGWYGQGESNVADRQWWGANRMAGR